MRIRPPTKLAHLVQQEEYVVPVSLQGQELVLWWEKAAAAQKIELLKKADAFGLLSAFNAMHRGASKAYVPFFEDDDHLDEEDILEDDEDDFDIVQAESADLDPDEYEEDYV